MVLGDDKKFFYEYTRFLELGPLFAPHMKRAIFIGGGAFTMPKALHLMKPDDGHHRGRTRCGSRRCGA